MGIRLVRLTIVGLLVSLHASWAFALEPETLPVDSCDGCTPGAATDKVFDDCWGAPVCRLFDPEATTLLGDENLIDTAFDTVLGVRDVFQFPVNFGAWHWLHTNIGGPFGSGYGIPPISGTYYWWVSATPEYEIRKGLSVGAHTEYRLRDSGNGYRTFFTDTTWFYEAYGFVRSDDFGTFKFGQLLKQFGLNWAYGFWPTTSNFDGYMQDPDYGISWESTDEFSDRFSVQTIAQYFIVQDGVNGTFANSDPESVVGLKEQNTAVLRVVPQWTFDDESSLVLGVNGLVQQVDSHLPGFSDSVVAAWGLDAIYTRGPWQVKSEVIQTLGRRVPMRYTSGGPSNRITDLLIGTQYTHGITSLYADYSLGFDDNPAATHEIAQVGTSLALSKYVTCYFEYVHEDVKGNATLGNYLLFNSFNWVFLWSY